MTDHRCCETCTTHLDRRHRVGTTALVERDETRWPSTGTWPRYAGRTGAITTINIERVDDGPRDTKERRRIFHVEYGVDLGGGRTSWFLPHELTT